MRRLCQILAACAILFPVLCLSARLLAVPGQTRLELTDEKTGRMIAARLLDDGEKVVLTWTNSLFRLPVTEVLVAGGGVLTLTEITFSDPTGREPPRVKPEDVNDLYHTGGPFRAEGLSRPVRRVVFRVGEIGDPAITVRHRIVRFAEEVGFGGAVLLTARPARFRERLAEWLRLRARSSAQPVIPYRAPCCAYTPSTFAWPSYA